MLGTHTGELPPDEHVARALVKLGARHAAVAFLEAVLTRQPHHRTCLMLLDVVRHDPEGDYFAPVLDFHMDMVFAYCHQGLLREARAVLRGSGLAETPDGAVREAILDELLQDPEPSGRDVTLRDVATQLRSGGAHTALSILDQRIQDGLTVPAWALRFHTLLQHVLLDVADVSEMTVDGAHFDVTAKVVRALRSRDLRCAREMLDMAPDRISTDDGPMRAELGRGLDVLIREVQRAQEAKETEDGSGRQGLVHGTLAAAYQVSLGNYRVAARMYEALLSRHPELAAAREQLQAVRVVLRFLEADPSVSGVVPSTRSVFPDEATAPSPLSQLADTAPEARALDAEERGPGSGASKSDTAVDQEADTRVGGTRVHLELLLEQGYHLQAWDLLRALPEVKRARLSDIEDRVQQLAQRSTFSGQSLKAPELDNDPFDLDIEVELEDGDEAGVPDLAVNYRIRSK